MISSRPSSPPPPPFIVQERERHKYAVEVTHEPAHEIQLSINWIKLSSGKFGFSPFETQQCHLLITLTPTKIDSRLCVSYTSSRAHSHTHAVPAAVAVPLHSNESVCESQFDFQIANRKSKIVFASSKIIKKLSVARIKQLLTTTRCDAMNVCEWLACAWPRPRFQCARCYEAVNASRGALLFLRVLEKLKFFPLFTRLCGFSRFFFFYFDEFVVMFASSQKFIFV